VTLAGHRAEVSPEVEHDGIAELIEDAVPISAALDQARGTKDLQVLASVRHREPGLCCDSLDRPLTIREHIEDLETPAVAERLPEPGELIEQRSLGRRAGFCLVSGL
jgi:hypothetical protein